MGAVSSLAHHLSTGTLTRLSASKCFDREVNVSLISVVMSVGAVLCIDD